MKKPSASALLMPLMWGGCNRLPKNPVGADEKVVHPPQTEEYKYYYLARAEAKRNRRKEAHLYRKKWNIK